MKNPERSLFQKKTRRSLVELPLTPLIDIFSLIVIFLILGTVFGAADMKIPPDLFLPHSKSKEEAQQSPQVVLRNGSVRFLFLEDEESERIESATLNQLLSNSGARRSIEGKIATFLKSLSKRQAASGRMINLIADQNESYGQIYSTIRFLRQNGFQSVLFVSQSP